MAGPRGRQQTEREELRSLRYAEARRQHEYKRRYAGEQLAVILREKFAIPAKCDTAGHADDCTENPSLLLGHRIMALVEGMIAGALAYERAEKEF